MVVPRRRPLRYLLLSICAVFFIWYFVIPVSEDADSETLVVPERLAWQVKSARVPPQQPNADTPPSRAENENVPAQTASSLEPPATQTAPSFINSDTELPEGAPPGLTPEEKDLPAWSRVAQQTPLRADTGTEHEAVDEASSKYERPALNVPSQQIGKHKFYPKHAPSTLNELSGTAKRLPKLQHKFEKETADQRQEREDRRESVRDAFKYAWSGYKNHSWLEDELMPVSGKPHSAFGGWAATLVDALDTLWIMGLKQEFEEAVRATRDIDFSSSKQGRISVFETTIRYLGGFLGAYDISEGKYPALLEKAKEVADLLFCAFDTPNHMPVTSWGWQAALEGAAQTASFNTILADFGSLSLEFTRLTQLTGDMRYFDGITRISQELQKAQNTTKIPGLWPSTFDANNLNFMSDTFTVGALADSTYEYLPKQYMLLGGQSELVQYDQMYTSAIKAIIEHLTFQPMLPKEDDILFTGNAQSAGFGDERRSSRLDAHTSHLSCFVGGMVGMGAILFDQPAQLDIGRRLTEGCIWAYAAQPSGIMPEGLGFIPCETMTDCKWDEVRYNQTINSLHNPSYEVAGLPDNRTRTVEWLLEQQRLAHGITEVQDRRYLLRPEAIESVFIHYRLTGQRNLQDKAWHMFTSIMDSTSTAYANSAIVDVTMPKGQSEQMNSMESFWLAETLKYFFLIFSEPDVVSLDEWVLNTEAHTFRRPRAGEKLVQVPPKKEEKVEAATAGGKVDKAEKEGSKVDLKGRGGTAAESRAEAEVDNSGSLA